MDNINKTLREQAIELGLCQEWQTLWSKGWSKQKMADMMFRGLDFCIKKRFPSIDFILQNFDTDFRRKNNIFVNDNYSAINTQNAIVIGTSNIKIRCNGNSNANIHICNTAKLYIEAKNRCFVIVHLHDSATVEALQFDKAKIILINHSPSTHINADEKRVKIREEINYLK